MAGESARNGREIDGDCKSRDLDDSCAGGYCDFADGDVFQYLVVNPHGGGVLDLLKYGVWGDTGSGVKFLESSKGGEFVGAVASDHRWVIVVSIIARRVIAFFGKPMEWTGFLVDFVLNLLSENGNFLGLIYNLIRGTPFSVFVIFVSSYENETAVIIEKRLEKVPQGSVAFKHVFVFASQSQFDR